MDVENFFVTYQVWVCSVTLLIVISLITWILRNQFGKILVNCWFCNTNATVLRKQKNSWTCDNCQQYNGFKKNGDYNEHLPAMHDESLNTKCVSSCFISSSMGNAYIPQQVQLCYRCSRNQLLKVKQLSQFKPLNEDSFDTEASEYKNKLDQLYELCPRCKEILCRHIKMQDTIIRGKMMSKKQQDKVTQLSQKPSNVASTFFTHKVHPKRNIITIICWFNVMLLSYLNLFYFLIAAYSFTPTYLIYVYRFLEIFLKEDIYGFIVVSGLTLSITGTRMFYHRHTKSHMMSVFLWMSCVAFAYTDKHFDDKEKDFATQVINFYSNDFEKARVTLKPIAKEIFFYHFFVSEMMIIYIRGLICFLQIWFSSKNLFHALTLHNDSHSVSNLTSSSSMQVKKKSRRIKDCRIESSCSLNASMYSDCSMPSDDETCLAANKQTHLHQELNGSLNALKLQDNTSNFNQFKHPNALFTEASLPSSLPTPPPSRSSSLLSLSSCQSLPTHNSINKFGSTVAFARPSAVPFSKPKAKSTITGFMSSQSQPSLMTSRSVTSYSPVRYKTASAPGIVDNLSTDRSTVVKRPLISPAKLRLHNVKMRRFDGSNGDDTDSVENTVADSNKSLDQEISVYDSASQVGGRGDFDFSDDDDMPRPLNLNSSSPKSTISNITTATLESVKTVENSRLCRWILAGCLFLNLILVVLLVAEVREMREKEQWKSGLYV